MAIPKKVYKAIFASITLLLFSICSITNAKDAPIPYSEFQLGFMRTIKDYAIKYNQAPNELKKSALVTERLNAFRTLKGNPKKISGWYGVITKMGTNGDGKAYVTLNLSPNLVSVTTWNNAFSDMDDHTLIAQNSKMYTTLSNLKVGNVVKFSGKLAQLTNMTEADKMTNPVFLFKFSNIEPFALAAE